MFTGNYTIEVYAHGDIHGCFFDSLYTGDERKASLANISGYVNGRRADKNVDGVILLDLGDNIHGDNAAYYYNYVHKYSKGEKHIYSRITEFMQYDASVVGNHDIETGREIFQRVWNESKIHYLAGNLIEESDGMPLVKPYTVINRSGVKIAVVGLTTHEVKKWLGREKMNGLDVLPISNLAQKLVNEVNSRENPHFTVLALHSETGKADDENFMNSGKWLAENIKGIDLVLASHDHIPFCGKVWNGTDSIPVINSGPYGEKLSGVKFNITLDKGNVTSKSIDAQLIKIDSVEKDSVYMQRFREDYLRVKEFSVAKLGVIDADIVPAEIFNGPCVYSNLLHYVQLKESGADVSFVSPTKFRGTIPAGNISYNDILSLYPFENLLYKVKLTGAQIQNYLELSYNYWRHKPVSFDCAGGLEYTVDFSKQIGERVTVHSFTDGRKFVADSTYTVAMASYRANGGGELLLEATGLHIGQLDGIYIKKFGAIKDMLYNHFMNSNVSSEELAKVASWDIKGL